MSEIRWQHHALHLLIDKLRILTAVPGGNRQDIEGLLRELDKSLRVHFRAEEKGPPRLPYQEHGALSQRLEGVLERIHQGTAEALQEQVHGFLQALIGHERAEEA